MKSFKSHIALQRIIPLSFLLLLLFFATPSFPKGDFAVKELTCEYMDNPIGIDIKVPRLSWKMVDSRRGARQSAFQIQVASTLENLKSGKADIWDSGKILSDQSVHNEYKGAKLEGRKRYFWRVKIWDQNNKPSPWSEGKFWEMGLLNPEDWKAEYISLPNYKVQGPCPFFRKTFNSKKEIKRARAYATAKGNYHIYMNGKKINPDYFRPGWTNYYTRFQYQTYDVTPFLTKGENAFGAILGDGWYTGHTGFIFNPNYPNNKIYGDHTSLLVQLEIDYIDGTKEFVVTDESWKVTTGPILTADIFDGETYDANKELTGWTSAKFNDKDWKKPLTTKKDSTMLVAQYGASVAKIEERLPLRSWKAKDQKYIYDFGQNFAGIVRLKVKGQKGDTVVLRFAEVLDKDSSIYTTNLRSAKVTDTYILKGEGEEIFEPLFTYHGFRFVEVKGLKNVTPQAITGVVMHTDIPITGKFECSNQLVNQIQSNILWGQRSNFFEVPTDCPQRDERLGWMGDAQIFIKTASFNMDVASFFTKWLADVRSGFLKDAGYREIAPGVLGKGDYHYIGRWGGISGWGDAGVICPWTIYLAYGDKRILEENYETMAQWIDYLNKNSNNLIRPKEGFGDWLSINAETPLDLVGTAYFAYSTNLMQKIATVLGKTEDAIKYQKLFEEIKSAFKREYVTEAGRIFGNTQTSYILPLSFNLLENELSESAAKNLVEDIKSKNGHLSSGFLGTGYLLPTLTKYGYLKESYDLLLKETFPSWGFTIKNGATTMWERWDSWTLENGFNKHGMNSFNHYSFGAVGEWMYSTIGGIQLDSQQTGYKRINIFPQPGGGITYAKTQYETMYGLLKTDWEIKDGKFNLKVVVPPNTIANVYLPVSSEKEILESGKTPVNAKGINKIAKHNNGIKLEISAGNYYFTTPYSLKSNEK